ncbi:SLAP domain-containing protein [Lacticaseibacillus zhaodongensis]|uniref:SLAP domain-containing protein n=1 Tax=Lacticaseibacillus zhaodongensis TaxID=2668065 RepID=UPI0012D365BA|nr:SLAP domain-containing protein [Lacticaseibacillus zhaodongensis]
MKKNYIQRALIATVTVAATVLSTGAVFGQNFATGQQAAAATTAKPRYKKVLDRTRTYTAKDWPSSVLASGTKTIDVPYQADYKMNWNNVVKYFYEYRNQLAALNHAPAVHPDAATMAFAQKRALAQQGNDLSHAGSGDYGENLEFIEESSQSDQEMAYNLVMGWYDDTYNVIPAHQSGHWGHRANLVFSSGRSGLGYNPQGGQVAYDFTEVSDWDRYNEIDQNTKTDKTTVGLPQTTFRYYHWEQLGKPQYDIAYKGVVVMKHAATLLRRNADNSFSKLKLLGKGQAYKTFQTVYVDGQAYYGVGGSSYVRSSDVTVRKYGTAHVNYNRHYGIQIWTARHQIGKNLYGSAKKLPGQTNWKVYGKATIDGNTYYNLGGDQYIDAHYVTVR